MEKLNELPLDELRYSILRDRLIRYRPVGGGCVVRASLPELLVALSQNRVRDFPALRPHQRHPWHAFLVQLSALVAQRSGHQDSLKTEQDWFDGLMELTPDDPDGAAWCLVSPSGRPALLQPPVPGERVEEWKSLAFSACQLDMLITSKNHDLKAARARDSEADDWLFAIVSLQSQDGFLGAGNYGVSRMNGGFGSRPGVGISIVGEWGARWAHDVETLLSNRDKIAQTHSLRSKGGHALIWLEPWDGAASLAFDSLDPFYLEICRRVRLRTRAGKTIYAVRSGSKAARIEAKNLNGMTGDPWTPIDAAAGKALTISGEGFHYKLSAELLFGNKFSGGAARDLPKIKADKLQLLAQGVARGQGKTEGYHERRIPISPSVRSLFGGSQRAQVGQIARQRIAAIGEVRKLLWVSLSVLFNNGAPGKDNSDSVKSKSNVFSRPFELSEDERFFIDLNEELEAQDPAHQRLQWLLGLAGRAEAVLRSAFSAGPRSATQRYRAQSAALGRFRGGLFGSKSPLPELSNHHRDQKQQRLEGHHEPTEQALREPGPQRSR